MKKKWLLKYVLPVFIVALFASGAALAQGYTLTRGTVDGGGGASTSSGSSYTLSGTIGQPDAGSMSGGSGNSTFTLGGGFWGGGQPSATTSNYQVYLPLIIR